MKIHSDSFQHRQRIPAEFAAGQPTADGFGFAPNRNPHLAWSDAPDGTQSFALLCIDPDAPTDASPAQSPVAQPRTDFTHWAIVDIPADLREPVLVCIERREWLGARRQCLNFHGERRVRPWLPLQDTVGEGNRLVQTSGSNGRPSAADCLRVACRLWSLSRRRRGDDHTCDQDSKNHRRHFTHYCTAL